MKDRISALVRTLRSKVYQGDMLSITLLVAISLYLTRPLLHLNTRVLFSDLGVSWAWLYWLRESIFTFHQFPTWSPLWMGGMPYFGMVPPVGFYLALPLYLMTGSAPAAYNLGMIIMFCLCGAAMYLYLKHLSRNSLLSLLGAIIYLTLPVSTSAFMVHGLFEIFCGYAVAPLVLLFTERFIENRKGLDLLLLSLCLSFVALVQIEHSFLFLLFFYLPYLIFTLFLKKVGVGQLLAFAKRNKACVIAVMLIILIPISFYIPLLAERGNFKGLLPHEIEGGLNHWTFEHFSDTFTLKASDVFDTFDYPATEHYSGPIAFVILLAATFFLARDRKGKHAAQLMFFLLMAIALLILSMGLFGPLFPPTRAVVPFLADMRVAVRFYPFFALCLPVLFVLSALSFIKFFPRIPRASARVGSLLVRGIPILLVIVLVLDFVPYFDFYHIRVMDHRQMYESNLFLKDRLAEDSPARGNHARVLIYPIGGNPDRFSSVEQTDTGQFTIEITQTSLPWDQYKHAVDYYNSVSESIAETADHLAFYSNFMSIDYILVYSNKIPPIWQEEYVSQKLAILDSYCGDAADLLRYRGSLDTDYYTIYLYELEDVPSKVKFHPTNSSLMVASDDTLISTQLFSSYGDVSASISASAFVNKVVAVSGNIEDVVDQPIRLVSLDDLPALLVQETETPSYDSVQIGETSLTAKGLSFDIEANEKGILSLTYYYNPWWEAYVDGEQSPVLRVNGVFAGTYLTEGQHRVEFVYDYPSLPNVISRLWR
jgi:hypothetical protein